jgi:integrase
MPNLTKSFVEKLTIPKQDTVFWDDKLSGFGIKITPKGRRVYILKYRNKEGRQRKPTIGIHGSGMTCEGARDIAIKWLGEVAKGNDPSQARKIQRQSPTISDLCDRYLEEHSKVHKKSSSTNLESFYIKKHIKPKLGAYKTLSITQADIVKFHSSMKETPTQANRILQTLSKMFNLAEIWGLRDKNSNPIKGIKRFKEQSRERFLSDEEISRLQEVLDKAEKEGTESIYFLNLIRLLMLSGARLSEIQKAKWEWIDKKSNTLNLPDSKTGKKSIFLSPTAMKILEKTPRIVRTDDQDENPFIIIGDVQGKPLHNVQKPWQRIRKQAGLDDLRIHDLRHTFASICIGQGFSLQMVSKLLGHTDTRMSERYAHLATTSIQGASKAIGEYISTQKKDAKREQK